MALSSLPVSTLNVNSTQVLTRVLTNQFGDWQDGEIQQKEPNGIYQIKESANASVRK